MCYTISRWYSTPCNLSRNDYTIISDHTEKFTLLDIEKYVGLCAMMSAIQISGQSQLVSEISNKRRLKSVSKEFANFYISTTIHIWWYVKISIIINSTNNVQLSAIYWSDFKLCLTSETYLLINKSIQLNQEDFWSNI